MKQGVRRRIELLLRTRIGPRVEQLNKVICKFAAKEFVLFLGAGFMYIICRVYIYQVTTNQ